MYCSTCGNSVNENLNYCNSCGARLGNKPLQPGHSSSPFIYIGVAGLIGFILVLKILLDNHVDPTVMVIILIAYLATVFLLCAVTLGQNWHHSAGVFANPPAPPAEDYAAPKQIRTETTNQLEAPREPFIGSVTENTTRTFEHVPIKEK
jgi:hypothetical protein